MANTVRAAIVQTEWTGDKESMIEKHVKYVHQAAEQGTEVRTVGFPSGLPYTTDGTVATTDTQRVLYDMRVSPGASNPVQNERNANIDDFTFNLNFSPVAAAPLVR